MQSINFALHFSKNFWQKKSLVLLKCSRNSNTTTLNSETTFDQMQTEVLEEPVFSSHIHRHLEEMLCLYMAKMNRTAENCEKFRKGRVFEQFLKHCRIKPVLCPPKLE